MSSLLRWTRFNGVGLAGTVVQLAVLSALTKWLDVPVALATAAAVETAILHNFFWHQRWTWRDRPTQGTRETLARLRRFHAVNGLVSLVGNVIITTALVHAGIHPVAANVIAIMACSIVNYTAGDACVFRTSAGMTVVLLASAAAGVAQAQSREAVKGWDTYVASVEARYWNAAFEPFFALDARKVNGWRQRAQSGAIPMAEVEPPGVANAKMHHWAGAVFVPRTTVEAVVSRMQQGAGLESEHYAEVKVSRLLQRDGDRLRVFMKLERDATVMTVTYNTEHAVEYRRLGARATSRSISTKIAEVADAGTAREKEKGAGGDHGFLWRLNAYWRFEQLGDGVLIECESVSLSRSVPFVVRPVVGPIANRIARESLERTLRSLRAYLTVT
ncbi:MAG: GtrA family protein [Acidobacteria bacterium]|nr:GtrA family protein [Acidobacteriota bacterium]